MISIVVCIYWIWPRSAFKFQYDIDIVQQRLFVHVMNI